MVFGGLVVVSNCRITAAVHSDHLHGIFGFIADFEYARLPIEDSIGNLIRFVTREVTVKLVAIDGLHTAITFRSKSAAVVQGVPVSLKHRADS